MFFFLRKCLKYFIYSGLFSLFINALYLTFPIYMLAIYVRVLPGHSFPTLYAVTAIALAALLVFGFLDFLRSRLLVQAGVAMDATLSRPVLENMLLKSAENREDDYSTGLKDVNMLRNFLAGNAIFAFFDIPWVPIYLAIIYLIHPILGLVATGGAVVLLFLGLLQELLTRKKMFQIQGVNQEDRKFVSNSIRNAEMLRCMGMLKNISRHRNKLNDIELGLNEDTGKKSQMVQSVSKSFRIMMQIFIFGAGALLVLQGEAHSGVIIAASIIMGRALAPVDQVLGTWKQSREALSAYRRLDRLMETSPSPDKIRLKEIQGRLSVKDVSLSLNSTTILDGISFELSPGQMTALIGPNGAGKSTLCRVALGIWPPDKGQVLMDDVPVYNLDPEQASGIIGYLPQDVELFPGTVAENIARMGRVDFAECMAAAKKAGVHDVILYLPHGYKTDLVQSGINLSGGQRQRIGLARALYGDPELIILDEPTSNLDEQSANRLMDTLVALRDSGKAVLLITHAPHMLSRVDMVLILKQGRVSYYGPAQEALQEVIGSQSRG